MCEQCQGFDDDDDIDALAAAFVVRHDKPGATAPSPQAHVLLHRKPVPAQASFPKPTPNASQDPKHA